MASELTAAELDELARLEAAATKGDWRIEGRRLVALKEKYVAELPSGGICHCKIDDANAAFIAASRNAFRALLALARKGLAADAPTPAEPAATTPKEPRQ